MMMKQVKYNNEIWEVETIYVYDEYISIYRGGHILDVCGEHKKVKLCEVEFLKRPAESR